MKKLSTMLVFTFLFSFIVLIVPIFAVSYDDVVSNLASRTACSTGQYEVALIKSDGTISKVGCYTTYNEAETSMNNTGSTSTSVASIIQYVSSTVKQIIDAKYAMLDLKTKSSSLNTNIYSTSTASSASVYINGSYGTDAPMLDYYADNSRAKLRISGYTGWIRKIDADTYKGYDVVPLSLVKSPTYYYVSADGDLLHRLTYDIAADNGYTYNALNLGPAPSFMKLDTKYYSFDGNYFYTSLITMITDYKNNSYANAVNATSIYYNYYQYLPYRTKTTYTSTDINEYIKSRGYIKTPITYPVGAGESMLYSQGPNFIDAQDKYGANALLAFGTAVNESGWGTSQIAVTKNNLFGHSAYDYDPLGSADSYSDVKYSIYVNADVWISFGYAYPTDWRYNGSHLGNKASGMNVRYATDPYWGEKAAAQYYSVDKALGKYDYKQYQVGLKNTTSAVNVRNDPNTSSTALYQFRADVKEIPVVILGEVTGETIDGSNIWYKIQSDPALSTTRTVLPVPADGATRPTYDWTNSYAYVHSSVIDIIGEETQFTKRDGSFYFDKFSWNSTTQTINFRGYLIVKGVNNSSNLPASYSLILKDVNDSSKEYIISLDRWTNTNEYPFQIPNLDGYDYSASWFNANISLKDIPQGDYVGYVRARINKSEATVTFRNMFAKTISSKITDTSNRGYLFKTNYYIKDVPLEIFIRDGGLISASTPPTRDNMINTYHKISFNKNLLNIRGTSFNIGANYATTQTVTRTLVLENQATYAKKEFASNYIDNGDYTIVLRLPDGLSKTRAWFDSNIDVATLDPGTYTIYIKTKTGTVEDYGELNDVFVRTLNQQISFGDKTVLLQLNKNKRMRLELVVKQNDIVNDITNMTWDTNGINIEGWAFSKNGYPDSLDNITQKLILTNTVDSSKQEIALTGIEVCSISDLTNCELFNQYVGYKSTLDLRTIPNGRYLLSIDTTVAGTNTFNDKLVYGVELINKIVRAKIGNDEKLLTFEHLDDGIYLTVADFAYTYDIVIDVGHCKYCDTVGTSNSTIAEYALNYIVSAYEKERYEDLGVTVWMNRTSTDGTGEMMVDNGWSDFHRMEYTVGYVGATAKIVYSNHHNGSYATATGYEIILPASYTAAQVANERAIYDAWSTMDTSNIWPSSNHDGFYTRDYYDPAPFLTKINGEVYDVRNYYGAIRMPLELFNVKSVIYEPIYMTNSTNFAWYYTSQNWKKMSELKIQKYVEALGKTYAPDQD